MNTAKAERATKMLAFITEQANAGRTCYLATPLRVISVKAKHLPMIRVRGDSLEVQQGKRWVDATYTNLSAR